MQEKVDVTFIFEQQNIINFHGKIFYSIDKETLFTTKNDSTSHLGALLIQKRNPFTLLFYSSVVISEHLKVIEILLKRHCSLAPAKVFGNKVFHALVGNLVFVAQEFPWFHPFNSHNLFLVRIGEYLQSTFSGFA